MDCEETKQVNHKIKAKRKVKKNICWGTYTSGFFQPPLVFGHQVGQVEVGVEVVGGHTGCVTPTCPTKHPNSLSILRTSHLACVYVFHLVESPNMNDYLE